MNSMLNTFLPTLLLLVLLQASSTTALLLPHHSSLSRRQSATLPPSNLPLPPANLTLKYIALGQGTQNYTCTSFSPLPISVGAVATLYDMTALALLRAYSSAPGASTCLSALLPQLSSLPALFAAANMPVPTVLGHHFFSAGGSPSFDLSGGERLQAKKVADVAAPAGACPNAGGEGAVDWLELWDNGQGWSRGLSAVYRVETAGGKAPSSCIDSNAVGGVVTSAYSAQYWFYG